ncbi:MAG: quinolinate synthase [Bacillota bacterium]
MDIEIERRISRLRHRLGHDVSVVAHYYAPEGVRRFADEIGDSLQLAQVASRNRTARHLIFCGVRFMAETASLLAGTERNVYLPRPEAGCPLADCARIDDVEGAWQLLGDISGDTIPITYVNSSTELKAFCGERDGATCTSSSAMDVFRAVLKTGARIFFFPDRNLGANTARMLAVEPANVVTFDPATRRFLGDRSPEDARVILWRGSCPVHTQYSPKDVIAVRREGHTRVAVHPECDPGICEMADEMGSTAHMVRAVARSDSAVRWAVGTETNLVDHMKKLYPDRVIEDLGSPRVCRDMHIMAADDLLDTLQDIIKGRPERKVDLSDSLRPGALTALQNMFAIVEGGGSPW